jgi:hypothetical protein
MRGIEAWAGQFIDREVSVPKTDRRGVVVSVEPGKRGRGVWLILNNGDSVYRQFPKSWQG